ncbi:MAG: cytochrome b/b6 domain-containing protein [Propionivibrio sp.]
MKTERIRLWDLPTRIFHWLLVILIVGAIITGKVGGAAIEWHGRIGQGILGLIVFRIVWGFIGSSHARFARFIPTPSSVRAYLRGDWKGVGHNPLGALSILAMLVLIGVQAGTGIFANDDIAFQGPLSALVDKSLSDWLTGIHKLSINLLIALIALHLAAIAFYAVVRKDNLVKPMLTGWKDVPPGQGESATGGGPIAFVVALAIALGAVYAASGKWIEQPAPVAGATTPARA